MDLEKLETVKVVSIGYVSLVGIMANKYPVEYGNYFSMRTTDNREFEISNMWYENLNHLIDTKVVSYPIQVKVLNDRWAMVYDSRVPDNFLMETSYRAPKEFWSLKQLAKRQLQIDSGELKVSKYKDNNGNEWEMESREIKATRRALNVTWGGGEMVDKVYIADYNGWPK